MPNDSVERLLPILKSLNHMENPTTGSPRQQCLTTLWHLLATHKEQGGNCDSFIIVLNTTLYVRNQHYRIETRRLGPFNIATILENEEPILKFRLSYVNQQLEDHDLDRISLENQFFDRITRGQNP